MLAEFIQIPKEGETIGPYLLRKHLSSSIIGSFFSATHKGLHESVLIHIIPEALLRADSRFHARYEEVIERQKRLSDPAALAATAVNRIAGNLVVQYPGGNYRSMNDVILKRRDPMPVDTVQTILQAIGNALEDAAKIEQMHLFLTPDFLFLNEDGEVRVAGIGLFQSISYPSFERFVSGAVIPIQVDKANTFEAIEILSPEIRNFKKRDQRSDFYCIGMCAYFMLTRTKPVRKWLLPSKVRKEINPGWDLFISHCLEPKPADRFPHYRAFLRDLNRIEDLTGTPSSKTREGQIMRTLNRVPVPKELERILGMRAVLILRLVMLGFAGALAVGTAALLNHILVSDFDQPDEVNLIRRVRSVDAANMIFEISPNNAMVVVSGAEAGRFVVQDADLMLFGRSGSYSVEISAPKRRPQTLQLDLVASEPQRREVNLSYDFASVRIEGAVGTDVYIENSPNLTLYIGTILDEGGLEVSDRLLKGKHTLLGRHKAFLPFKSEPVTIDGKGATVTFEQVPRPTELVVLSEPDGASVYIGDAHVGLTPLRVEGLEVGLPIDVRVDKKGYRQVARTVEFSKGQSQTLNAGELVAKIGELEYTLVFPMENPPPLNEFFLTINDAFYRLEDSFSGRLPEGEYSIFLSHPDFFTFEQTVEVTDNETTRVTIAPVPRPMRLVPIIEGDFPARFRMAGEEVQLTEKGVLLVPSFQRVKVEATIRDHHDVIQWVEGRANEVREWKVPLMPLPGPVVGEDFSPPYFNIQLVWIAPERFKLGSPISEPRRIPNEDSLTTVNLDYGYWISTTEISQEVYRHVMGANPSEFSGDELPVDSVSWNDAVLFCERLTEFESRAGRLPPGTVYRLPTEAEWEYAARANTATPFSFGSAADPSKGNFHGSYSADGEVEGKSAADRYGSLPVGSFPPNPFGLHDVHGNVAEWVLDRFWDRHPGGSVTNPYNGAKGRGYTIRGGSWRDSADRVRTAAREGAPGSTVRNSIGFRVVIAPEPGRLGN